MIFKRLFRRAPPPALPSPEALAQTALHSEDAAAQREACRAIEDLTVLRQIAEQAAHAGTRDLAAARYRHILCDLPAQSAQTPLALAEIDGMQDAEQLAPIALSARAPELRRAAIDRLPGDAPVLARCAVDDALPGHRQAAVERLSARHLLEQVIRQIGKRDTKVYRLAREKLRLLAQIEERPRLAQQRGFELRAQLERLGCHNNWIHDHARLKLLDQQWTEIEVHLPPEDHDHYQRLRAAFLAGYEQHTQANARLELDQQQRTERLTRQRELLARLQALASSTADADQLAAELSSISEAWNTLDAEHPLHQIATIPTQQSAASQKNTEPGAENAAWVTLRGAAAQAYATALARQHQLTRALGASDPPPPQDNQAGSHPQSKTHLLSDIQTLLAAPGPIDQPSANQLQKQLESLLVTEPEADAPDRQPTAAALENLERRLGKQRRHAERKLALAPEQLQQLSRHLDAGELRKAESLYQKVTATLDLARAAGLSRAEINLLNKQLKQHQTQLRELQRWRRWSADQGRESLCHEAESLATQASATTDSELATLAARLHQLRCDWRRIDQSSTPAGESFWQRFKQATDQVAARCEPYFKARAERQRANLETRRLLCGKLEHFLAAVDWDSVDWKAMVRAEREMRQAWNALEPPEEGARGGLERRFRRALAQIEQALKKERKLNQAYKRDLIERMQNLAETDDIDATIAQAKILQKQWHTTVAGRQQEENALWQQFRTASDTIFARRHQERTTRDQELKDHQARCEALCEQAESLLRSPAEQTDQLTADWHELARHWRDARSLPLPRPAKTRLEQRWLQAEQALLNHLQALRDQADWREIDQLRHQSDFLSESARQILAATSLPQAEELTARWAALRTTPADTSQPNLALAHFDHAFATLLAALAQPAECDQLAETCASNRHQREDLCLRLEILAHLPSPPALAARRMELQVARLQEKLSAGDADPLTQSKPLLQDWYLATPAAADTELQARFSRIESALRPVATAGPSTKPRGNQQ